MFRAIVEGVYPHCRIARREIYLQCRSFDVNCKIRRCDVAALTEGDGELRPLVKQEMMDKSVIPHSMRMIMDMTSCWKFEWMRDGSYSVVMGLSYSENIVSSETISRSTAYYAVPPKLVDTMNCVNESLVYLMWCESMRYQLQTVRKTDLVYWCGLGNAKRTLIEMTSYVTSKHGIMTLTRLCLVNDV